MIRNFSVMAVVAGLAGCAHNPDARMAEEGYFPPLGLGQEAVALDQRRTSYKARRPAPAQSQTINQEIPLDQIEFEDEAAFASGLRPQPSFAHVPLFTTAHPRPDRNTALTGH